MILDKMTIREHRKLTISRLKKMVEERIQTQATTKILETMKMQVKTQNLMTTTPEKKETMLTMKVVDEDCLKISI